MRFGFLADQDRTRFAYLRLRRLKEALADPNVIGALLGQLESPAEDTREVSARAKLAVVDQRIERLRATNTSVWFGVPAPEVLAGSLFAASKHATGALAGLFSPARGDGALSPAVVTWLEGGGLTLYEELPPGTGFDLVGYYKGMLSGARVVGVAVKNDANEIEPALERMKALEKYTQAMHLACTPAVAAEYLSARAAASGRWDAQALASRLRAAGIGLLLVEGDAVAQAMLPKSRVIDAKALAELEEIFAPRAK